MTDTQTDGLTDRQTEKVDKIPEMRALHHTAIASCIYSRKHCRAHGQLVPVETRKVCARISKRVGATSRDGKQ